MSGFAAGRTRGRSLRTAHRFLFALVAAAALLAMVTPRAAPASGAGIATAHPEATVAGREILELGGNAFDAAVAVSAALAVVEPMGSGLGGGGFWLLHRASDGFEIMIDGRERAPLAASADMYRDESGEVLPRLSLDGALAAAIPGEPAALVHIAENYGRLPLSRSLAPAIRLARDGFVVTERYRALAAFRADVLDEEAAGVFLVDGEAPPPGYRVRQPGLAATLARLAESGHEGFYAGSVAEQLVAGVRAAGGIWTREDLESYRVIEREPVRGTFRDLRITSAALPSSGGIVLVEMLNILEPMPLAAMTRLQRARTTVEAMRHAYRDRAEYLGDPDFVEVPAQLLMSPAHAARLRTRIGARATPSDDLPAVVGGQGSDTTHFSIVDGQGNRVAATLSINYPFGCGVMPPGTGVILNNEMDDFVASPGVPNVYGLVGSRANAVAPGKRPLSSMTPTFLDDGRRVLVLGTPGGSRIITMVLLAALEFAIGDGDVSELVKLPRYHHQYLPDTIVAEPGALEPDLVSDLEALGYEVEPRESSYGNMQAVLWHRESDEITAASDPRGEGSAMVLEDSPTVE